MGRSIALVAALACALVFPALGAAQEADPVPRGVAAARVVHVAVEAGAVDLRIGAGAAFVGLEPTTATGYRIVPAGDTVLAVVPAGAESRAQGPGDARDGTSVTLQAGGYYTLLIFDEFAGPGEALPLGGGARGFLIEDAMDAFPAAGQAWVRVVHVLQGVTSLSARATPLGARGRRDRSGDAQDAALASELAPGEHAEWVTLRAGIYALEHEAGGETDMTFRPEVTLHGGTLYSVFVYGPPAGPSLLVTVDAVLRDTPDETIAFPESIP